MMPVPSSSRASWVRPLTVACVPTGMNTGVSNAPWGVVKRPRRAPDAQFLDTSNEKSTSTVYQEVSGENKSKPHAEGDPGSPNPEGHHIRCAALEFFWTHR